MDDDRLRRQLNAADGPMQPPRAFREGLKAQLMAELDLAVAVATPVGGTVGVRRRDRHRPGWWLVAAALVAIALLGATLGAGAIVRWLDAQRADVPIPAGPGGFRVAVRPDGPQVLVPGTGLGGYDVDVAEELGRRLGREVRLVIASPDEMLAQRDAWDLALPSAWLPASATGGLAETSPYYHWPVFLLAAPDRATTVGDLDGTTVCVVAGSGGEAWLEGRTGDGLVDQRAGPPVGAIARAKPDDAACLRDLRDGLSDAVVTAEMTRSDADATAGVAVIGDQPVLVEPRSMLLRADDEGTGDALRTTIDEALTGLRADGTLARLSALRFGGDDLSTPASP